MHDATGGDFNPSSLDAIQNPTERIKTTHSWVAEILRNNGISLHEADVAELKPPRLTAPQTGELAVSLPQPLEVQDARRVRSYSMTAPRGVSQPRQPGAAS
jgi:uncharacterized protein YabE (DUF348 family)